MGNDLIGRAEDAVISERIQEIHEIFLLLLCESDVEALVIEVHHVEQSRRRAVMKVGRPPGESAQDGPLESSDVLALAADQGSARIGDRVGLAGERSLGTG